MVFAVFDQDLAVCQSAKVFSQIMHKNLKINPNKYVEHNKKLFLLNLTTARVKTNLVKIGKKTCKFFFRFSN